LLAGLTTDLATGRYVCSDCQERQQAEASKKRRAEVDEARDRELALNKIARTVILTTTPTIDGFEIEAYIDIESVEFVIGTGLFSEFVSDWSDIFGLRSKPFESKLQAAKRESLDVLRKLAAQKGANAVVGIDLDYTEFSGNRIGLIANGTLVRVRRRESNGDGWDSGGNT
jgi:uncharacterized protein YbjQ (UPF0145 family)